MKDVQKECMQLHKSNPSDPRIAELEQQQNYHHSRGKNYAMAADVLLPLGGAVAVTSIVLFILDAKRKKKETRKSVVPRHEVVLGLASAGIMIFY